MKGKKSAMLKQNKVPGSKQRPKPNKHQALLETMAIMNLEITKLTGEMKAMMNFNASFLEIAELNGLFSTQDVLQLMDANVKNSSLYRIMVHKIKEKPTDDVNEISQILGQQLFDHKLESKDIRTDIVEFKDFCNEKDTAEILELAEKYRKELEEKTVEDEEKE